VRLAVGGFAVAAVLASIQVLLLVPRSDGWGPSLVLLGMAGGAAVVLWVDRHRRTMSDATFKTVLYGLLAIAFGALGIPSSRYPRPHHDAPSMPPRLQLLLASVLLAGSLVMVSLVVWRRLRPPVPVVHEMSVRLLPYTATDLGHSPYNRLPAPLYAAGPGYYQAICACGWRGRKRDMDDPNAEDRATADAARHRPPQGVTRE
jgi:hypothetical protein